jgi:hypothetical protein
MKALTHHTSYKADTLAARGLGWFSIALGLAEVFIPEQIERMLGIGAGRNSGILRALGVREIGHGVDLLTHDDPTPGVWARVAGDALDGALFAAAGMKTRKPSSYATAAAMLLGVTIADIVVAKRLSDDKKYA